MSKSIVGVVLAGGRSCRMGQDKALLDWQGKPLLEVKLQQLEQLLKQKAVVSGDYAHYASVKDLPAYQHLGPLAGLYSSIKAQPKAAAWLFVPVDMPLLDESVLQILVAAYQKQATHHHITNSLFPLLIANQPQSLIALQRLVDSPYAAKRSIRQLLAAINSQALDLDEFKQQLTNTNTPEQWQSAQAFSRRIS